MLPNCSLRGEASDSTENILLQSNIGMKVKYNLTHWRKWENHQKTPLYKFTGIMYGCESWTIKKPELMNCGDGEDSWESIGKQGDETSQF